MLLEILTQPAATLACCQAKDDETTPNGRLSEKSLSQSLVSYATEEGFEITKQKSLS